MRIKLGRLRISIGRGAALCGWLAPGHIKELARRCRESSAWGITWGYQAHMDETYTEVFWGRWAKILRRSDYAACED